MFDILIAGGGMVGAALACALGNSHYRVAVAEAGSPSAVASGEPFDLRVSALTPASEQWLDTLGAWQLLPAARMTPFTGMDIWEGPDERYLSSLKAEDAGYPHLGTIAENRVIQWGLWEKMQRFENITVFSGTRLTGVSESEGGYCASTDAGDSIRARLIVATDGAASVTRRFSQIPVRRIPYHMHAMVMNAELEQPCGDSCWQQFTADGPRALLPLGGNMASLVWYDSPDRADSLVQLDNDTLLEQVRRHFPERLGGIRKIQQKAAFPVSYQHARRYFSGGIVLAGDSAHTIHPLAGQGVNLGFRDAKELAEQLLAVSATDSDTGINRALRNYQRRRQPANFAMLQLMHGFHHSFRSANPAVQRLRRELLRIGSFNSPFRKAVIRYGMGFGPGPLS